MSKKLQLLLSIFIGVLCLVLIFATTIPRERLTFLEKIWRDATFPVQKAFSSVGKALKNSYTFVTSLTTAQSEVSRLEKELEETRMELERFAEIRLENERLKLLLGFKEESDQILVPSRVIGRDPRTWLRSIIVDKGERHGVREGTPVVSHAGVIGHVTFTSAFTSQVTLILDPKIAVGGIVQRTRDFVVVGSADDTGHLTVTPLYQREEGDSSTTSSVIDIKEGDVVVTSGFGGIYPKGLNIGVVTEVHMGTEGISAKLKPSAKFASLEEVFVLLTLQPAGEGES